MERGSVQECLENNDIVSFVENNRSISSINLVFFKNLQTTKADIL